MSVIAPSLVNIASFNVRVGHAPDGIHSWPLRRYATVQACKELECDVIGLQEALSFQLKRILKRLPRYTTVGQARNGGDRNEYCSILFKRDSFTLAHSETKWFGETPDVPSKIPGARMNRIYTHADLVLAGGESISIFNTHLDEKSEERRQISMNQLLDAIDPAVPSIIMGDFNAKRSSSIFEKVEEHGLRFAHSPDCGGTTHGFSRKTSKNAIDHMLISEHFDVVSAEVIKKRYYAMLPSDHWPIRASLRLR